MLIVIRHAYAVRVIHILPSVGTPNLFSLRLVDLRGGSIVNLTSIH